MAAPVTPPSTTKTPAVTITLRVVSGIQVGVAADLTAYLTTEYTVLGAKAPVRGLSRSGDDGRWLKPMKLTGGLSFTLVAEVEGCAARAR